MSPDTIRRLAAAIDADLAARIEFLVEIDRLKRIERRSLLVDASRHENSAEHSWHLAMAAIALAPHAGPDVDIARAIEILLVHDIVEIDAGDTYIYDDEARLDKTSLEQQAADRLFSLLPHDQATRLRGLWDEYEARTTPTAQFAYALDRLQPLLLNAASGGQSWRDHGIAHSQTYEVNAPIADGSAPLWELARSILDRSAAEGHLVDDRPK